LNGGLEVNLAQRTPLKRIQLDNGSTMVADYGCNQLFDRRQRHYCVI